MCDTTNTFAALVTDIPGGASQSTSRRHRQGRGILEEIVVYLRRFACGFLP